MSSIESQRLRRIAILVSSVDAQAASQILLQLPSEVAEDVRHAIRNLGQVTEHERAEILREFEHSETQESLSPNADIQAARLSLAAPMAEQASTAAWHHIAPESFLAVCQDERPLVIAVILSQLPKAQATELLTRLPEAKALEALQAFQKLGEIQPSLRQDIENFLTQALHEHQRQLEQESQNKQRLEELLSQAPESVRQNWEATRFSRSMPKEHTAARATSNSQLMTSYTTSNVSLQPLSDTTSTAPTVPAQPPMESPEAHISLVENRLRQIERNTEEAQRRSVDRSLAQLEFEQLLELPQQILQSLLTQADPEIVLLALAGASPVFIGRLELMIEPEDFQNLNGRIRELGAMRITDIDEAQSRLVSMAKSWLSQSNENLKKAS